MNRILTPRRPALVLATGLIAGGLALSGCAGSNEAKLNNPPAPTSGMGSSGEPSHPANTSTPDSTDDHAGHGDDHDGHDHEMDGGPAPAGMVAASDPEFPVGSTVTLTADHMPGMDGAQATIVGAYDDTYAYEIDYTPTTGGAEVTDHKWVVQQELEGVGDERLSDGDTAKILASHVAGMEGAEATVVSSTDETVYMVDVDIDGTEYKNHKWITEDEIQPAS